MPAPHTFHGALVVERHYKTRELRGRGICGSTSVPCVCFAHSAVTPVAQPQRRRCSLHYPSLQCACAWSCVLTFTASAPSGMASRPWSSASASVVQALASAQHRFKGALNRLPRLASAVPAFSLGVKSKAGHMSNNCIVAEFASLTAEAHGGGATQHGRPLSQHDSTKSSCHY